MTALNDIDPIEIPGWAPSPAVRAAEAAVVGAAIRSRANAESAAEVVAPGDFYEPRYVTVMQAVASLIEAGSPVDEAAVLGELARVGLLDRGIADAMEELASSAAVPSGIKYHARAVAEDAVRRRLHQVGTRIHQITSNPGFDSSADIDLVRKQLEDATRSVTGDEPPTIGDLLLQVLDDLEQPQTAENLLPPPYLDLEMMVSGWRPGQMIVVGARPSIGKSLTAMDCARAAAIRLRMPTLVFSLEMSNEELMHRLLAAEATVSLDKFTKHQLDEDDWNRIARVKDRVFSAPMVIDDSPKCTLGRIRARLRGMQNRFGGCRLVVIDYLTLLEAPRGADSRERAVAEMARGIKLIAKEFKVPILLLAQLNRGPEHRNDRKPMISDLRESGAIEADADVVILLHREDFYDKESPRAGELDLIVAKQRNGPTGTVPVAFQGHYSRAVDMAPQTPSSTWGQR